MGESPFTVRHVGTALRWADRTRAVDEDATRDVRRCSECGWYNVFEVVQPERNGKRPPLTPAEVPV